MTQPQHTRQPYLRRWNTIGLGVAAIAVSVLLIATDGITGSSRWVHHPGISAAPRLLIAAAIAAGTLAQPRLQRRLLMPTIAALAFTAWGLAQLLPSSAAAGYLNDTAILLFVTDAAYAITVNARTPQPPHRRLADGRAAQPGPSFGSGCGSSSCLEGRSWSRSRRRRQDCDGIRRAQHRQRSSS